MNREILYRAKRTGTGEWIEGYYSEIKLTGTPYILTGEIAIEPCKKGIVQFECYEVWPETVCQYTGFNDIRGNKVFEHSIVFYEYSGVYGEVVFRDGKYEIKWQSGHDDLRVDVCFWFTQRRIHIVGNIFDDLELLEKEG
ncbi:MAG: hypothetical protein HFI26_15505 [Lachnospiraceae bacterium]|jgi:hypothetical protein|nr:hypothetical protein [Lachnospiraceae bacterium]